MDEDYACRWCGWKLTQIDAGGYNAWICPNENCRKRRWSTLPRVDLEETNQQIETEQGRGIV